MQFTGWRKLYLHRIQWNEELSTWHSFNKRMIVYEHFIPSPSKGGLLP